MKNEKRSYGQLCGLAASLDLLGERWTMLIMRELARGPKRFGDLLDELEGIGSNLLSARLKSLREAGVVEAVTLPPPASVAAYGIGPRGESLMPILEELALWGFELLRDADRTSLRSRAAWAAMSMKAWMDRADHPAPDGLYAFNVGDESFWLRVSDGESVLRDGEPPFDADASLRTDKEPFFDVAMAASTLSEAGVLVEGDTERLEALLETFRLPSPA